MTTSSRRPALKPVRKLTRFATPRTIVSLILREMASSYGRSPGGYVWVLLEPILGIALLSIVFSLGFKTPRLGHNFPIFYATGVMPYMLFSVVSANTAQALNYSRALLAYPRVTFMDAVIARFSLALLTQCIAAAMVLTGIVLFWETRTTLELGAVILSMTMAASLGLGVGLLNCFLFTMYPLWQRGYSILTRPLFLFSGIIFLMESFPRFLQDYLWYNPLMHATGLMRDAFFIQYEGTYVSVTYVFVFAGLTGLIGLIFLYRYHRDMMEL